MSAAEILGAAFGLMCVWLTVRQNIWCWPTGLLNNVFFIVLFVQDRLYADLVLQVFYIFLGLYGWWHWLYGGQARDTLPVTRTPARWATALALLGVAATLGLGLGLREAARWMNAPPASWLWWDSATTVACLIAQWMLARKLLENWMVWIATNVSYVGLYWTKQRFLLCALQTVFIALSVKGYRDWRRSLAGAAPQAAGGRPD